MGGQILKYYNNFKVEYRKGEQRVSDLKVPYINIKSSYGDSVNKELKKSSVSNINELFGSISILYENPVL